MINFYEALIFRYSKRVQELDDHIVKGGASDWAAYREKVGRRQELVGAIKVAQELYAKSTGEDEDFEDDDSIEDRSGP